MNLGCLSGGPWLLRSGLALQARGIYYILGDRAVVSEGFAELASELLSSLIERSPVVVATWRNAPGWPVAYISDNVRQFGYEPDDLCSGRVDYMSLIHPDDHIRNSAELERYLKIGPDEFQQTYRLRHADGHWIWINDYTWLIRDTRNKVQEIQGVLIDVSVEKRSELMNAAQVRLRELAESCDVKVLLQQFLDEAELLTDSTIGFYHFVEDDQNTIELQAWSSNTRRHMCRAEPDSMHYPVAMAGVWADAIRKKQAIIHNDYMALLERKGLPKGHAHIERELVVPVMRSQRVVAILGVGNKTSDYLEQDLEAVSTLADFAWEIIDRKRTQVALASRTEELEKLASYDPLTGLPNRALLSDRLEQAMAQAQRHQSTLALVFVDLDGFKEVNDRFGHAVGDHLLCGMAERLQEAVRAGDTVARLGGDEFILILPDFGTREQGHPLIERLAAAIATPLTLTDEGIELRVTASLGVTLYPQNAEANSEQLIRQADQAMYGAKVSGKNCIQYYC
jgi:diguanylate cyclase (GGDEF)-like protein/PAS domain S-box-containing protein